MNYAIGTTGADKKVGVVMPVYNDAEFVGQSIKSVLDQTYTDFHFYIIDNGSTDDTRYVLMQFADDPRVTIVRRNRNAHSQAAPDLIRSLGNEVLALIFSDDVWEPNKLERSMESLGDAAAVISNCAFMDDRGRPIYHVPPTQFYGDLTAHSEGELLYRILFDGNPIHPIAVVAKMEAYKRLGGYLPFMNRIGDMQFFTSLLINERCVFISDRLQRIRVLMKQSSTYTSKDLPGAKKKTQALFHEQYYNLQNFVSPAGLSKLHLIINEINESDSEALKLWIFGQTLIASRTNSYMLFGVNCLLRAAALDPSGIEALIEKAMASDVSHYFEDLFHRVGQDVFNLYVTTYDDAAQVAYLSARVAELEEFVREAAPQNTAILSGGAAKRRYEQLLNARDSRAKKAQKRAKAYTKCVQWLGAHPRIEKFLVGFLSGVSQLNLFGARRQFTRIHRHYYRPGDVRRRPASAPIAPPRGNRFFGGLEAEERLDLRNAFDATRSRADRAGAA